MSLRVFQYVSPSRPTGPHTGDAHDLMKVAGEGPDASPRDALTMRNNLFLFIFSPSMGNNLGNPLKQSASVIFGTWSGVFIHRGTVPDFLGSC
jgi:hypothetical protein